MLLAWRSAVPVCSPSAGSSHHHTQFTPFSSQQQQQGATGRRSRSRTVAVAAAAADGSSNVVPPSPQPADAGLEAFKALIAEKRFICTQCGKCCTGDGEVWIAEDEAVRMAAHLGMPLQRFYQQYTRAYSKVEGFKLLRAKDNAARDCIFLQPDNTCSIHAVRPLQCSTYPWWPDLMNDHDWAWEKENICEGFDHADAPPSDRDDAARQLRAATVQDYRRLLARKPSKKQRKAAAAATQHQQQQHSPQSSASSNSGTTSSSSSSTDREAPTGHIDQEASSSSSTNQQQQQGGSKRGTPAQQVWQQRLSRLQDLVDGTTE